MESGSSIMVIMMGTGKICKMYTLLRNELHDLLGKCYYIVAMAMEKPIRAKRSGRSQEKDENICPKY